MGFRLRSSGCLPDNTGAGHLPRGRLRDITVEFIGRDSCIKVFLEEWFTWILLKVRTSPSSSCILKKNGNDLTGSGRPAAAGDLFPVFFAFRPSS